MQEIEFKVGDVIEFSDFIYNNVERKNKVTVLKIIQEIGYHYICNFESSNLKGERFSWPIKVTNKTLLEWKNRGRKETS